MNVLTKEYNLTQQTPLIHFQSGETGATLRASEVKPKLDRFLLKRLGDGDYEKGIDTARENGWLIGEHPALKYKMRFKAIGNVSKSNPIYETKDKNGKLKIFCYGCYFLTEKNDTTQSSFYEKVKLQIICFDKELDEIIKGSIDKFFAINNFGLRQNKGFGSFIIKDKENESCNYANTSGYYLNINSTDNKDILNGIKEFYQELKNGINYNGEYKPSFLMKEFFKERLNDKKAMKIEILNTGKFELDSKKENKKYNNQFVTDKNDLKKDRETNYEYIRGMLGFANFYSFRKVKLKENLNVMFDLTFNVNGGEIKRFKSPITFKPIKLGKATKVFIIFDDDNLNRINGKEIYLKPNKINEKYLKQCTRNLSYEQCQKYIKVINSEIDNIEPIKLNLKIPVDFLKSLMKAAKESKKFKNLFCGGEPQ